MAREQTPGQLMAERLRESGITPRDASRLGLKAMPAEKVQRLNPSFMARPAMQIPYYCVKGKETGFYRLRYLGEPTGFDALRAKKLRYAQAPDTDPEVYFPPLTDWAGIAADSQVAVCVTEGEMKAACATALGVPTLGLGGVWSWRSAKKATPFIKALADFNWKERSVYLVFDSDYSTNPDVMRALAALARELNSRGAHPFLVTLPDLPALEEDGRKTGLDDFLVSEGRKALGPLLSEALPFSQNQELWALNGEVVYIRNPGLIVVLQDGRKVAPGAFKEHAYANRHFQEQKFDKEGNARLEKKPLAPAWLQWEQRSELARLTYRPGAPTVAGDEYNYWPGWGAEPRRGSVDPWRKLLDYMFRGDAKARQWFEQWAAYPVQNPGEKMYAAAVVWGARHGTGKSLIGYMLGQVYGQNFKEIDDEALSGGFNAWAENRQFVMADDLGATETGGSEAARRRATYEKIKFMVTRRTLTVNAKYMPEYEIPDCINYYLTANDPTVFALEDTDRRMFIWESPSDPLARAFYEECDAWLKSGACAAHLLWHLQRAVDCRGFNPRAPAMDTDAKRSMIHDGKGDVAAWVATLREDPEGSLKMGGVQLQSDLYSNNQLVLLYDPDRTRKATANALGREMKRGGFEQVNRGASVRTAKGPQRLYAVRNREQWRKASAEKCAEHWNEHCAGGSDGAAKTAKFRKGAA